MSLTHRPELATSLAGFDQRRPRRPCHYRAIHSGLDRSPADNHGQRQNSFDLRRCPPSQVTISPDLALGAGGRWLGLASALPCPAGRSVPGRGGPERRWRPRPDGNRAERYMLGTHPTGGQGSAASTSDHDWLPEPHDDVPLVRPAQPQSQRLGCGDRSPARPALEPCVAAAPLSCRFAGCGRAVG
jgi:hypothetical protein